MFASLRPYVCTVHVTTSRPLFPPCSFRLICDSDFRPPPSCYTVPSVAEPLSASLEQARPKCHCRSQNPPAPAFHSATPPRHMASGLALRIASCGSPDVDDLRQSSFYVVFLTFCSILAFSPLIMERST